MPLDVKVAPSETVSRYLLHSNEYTAATNRVKGRAFHPDPRNHKKSIFRIQGLEEREIWEIGEAYVQGLRDKERYARADLLVANVVACGLQIESDEPPPRHGNIVGYPVEKHAYMALAQRIAEEATLRLRD